MATQNEVAAALDISQQMVSTLVGRGVLPKAERGGADLEDARQRYLAYLRGARDAGQGAVGAGADGERPELLTASCHLAYAVGVDDSHRRRVIGARKGA